MDPGSAGADFDASKRLGTKMVKYIYEEDEEPKPHDRRKRWTGWEI